jgi:biotin transport system substrate-specific component
MDKMSETKTATIVSERSQLNAIGLVAIGVLLTYASAKVRVPFYPVPMTLQTMAVMALALAYGPRLAMASFGTYLALGAAGLPVFSETPEWGLGLSYMAGPTGGYLLGFLLASGVVGTIARGGNAMARCLGMLAGLFLIYAIGAAWLSHFVGSFQRVVEIGILRFLPGDFLKIALVLAGAALSDGYFRRKAGA